MRKLFSSLGNRSRAASIAFGDFHSVLYEEFKNIIGARKNKDLADAIIKMIENDKLRSIKISKDQFRGDSKEIKDTLIDIGEIIE